MLAQAKPKKYPQHSSKAWAENCWRVLGFRVEGLGFRVQGFGFRVRVKGLEFRV